jgi:hypothetical protein
LLHHPETIQPRHPGIRHYQLEISRIFLDARNRRPPVSRHLDVVSCGLQRLGKHVQDENVVVRAKNSKRLSGFDHRTLHSGTEAGKLLMPFWGEMVNRKLL